MWFKRNPDNPCKTLRLRLAEHIAARFNLETPWIQEHLARCPRCRHRLGGFSRVSLALGFIKSESHSLDLLRQANTNAISVLQRGLREVPRAAKLRAARPEPAFWQRVVRMAYPVTRAAACLAILGLMRLGIFSSIEKVQHEGDKALRHYYTSQLGSDLSRDLFT